MFGAGISVGTSGIGPQGAIGAQGDSSAAGAQGSQGSQGSQGILGTAGTAGAAGVAGSAGNQGFQGNQGAQGSQGAQGAQGAAAGPPVTGYDIWYDASDTSSITESGGAVSQWNDKSGNGYHLTQSTAGRKPTTGATTINSLNVIDFAGGDGLENASFPDTTANTWFFVFKVQAGAAVSGARLINGADNHFGLIFGNGSNTIKVTKVNAADMGTSGAYADNSATVASINYTDNSTYAFWKDGTANNNGSHAVTVAGTAAAVIIGAYTGYGLDTSLYGSLAEIIRYSSELGTTDRQSVESYLKTKWGTP